jgi:hypothetical protein
LVEWNVYDAVVDFRIVIDLLLPLHLSSTVWSLLSLL